MDLDSTFISWLIGQSGIGALAALALFLLDKSYKDALRREKETIEQGREDRRQLISVLAENAKSNASLQAIIENLTREMSRVGRGSRGVQT
jgi:hypothetical protein